MSDTPEKHIDNLEKVIRRVERAGLKFKPSKVEIFKKEIKFLGHIINSEGIRPAPERIIGLLRSKKPTNKKQIKSFCAKSNFWNRNSMKLNKN